MTINDDYNDWSWFLWWWLLMTKSMMFAMIDDAG